MPVSELAESFPETYKPLCETMPRRRKRKFASGLQRPSGRYIERRAKLGIALRP
jgi:hypothetical protein